MWNIWQNTTLTFVLLICSEIEKERRNMVILPPTNISGIFECEWNEGKGWNFHLNLIWIWKKWGKIPNSFIPQLPLTTGRSSKKMIKNFHDICHLADPPPTCTLSTLFSFAIESYMHETDVTLSCQIVTYSAIFIVTSPSSLETPLPLNVKYLSRSMCASFENLSRGSRFRSILISSAHLISSADFEALISTCFVATPSLRTL